LAGFGYRKRGKRKKRGGKTKVTVYRPRKSVNLRGDDEAREKGEGKEGKGTIEFTLVPKTL